VGNLSASVDDGHSGFYHVAIQKTLVLIELLHQVGGKSFWVGVDAIHVVHER
jgi:hypothetical protein